MWDNYQPNPQYRNYRQVPTEPSNNISLTPIEVVSDILDANQHEQDINTIDVTKYLPSDEKLDAIQSKVSTPFPSHCNQPGEVLVTTALSSETNGSQLTSCSHLNAHLPIPSNIRLLSNDSMNVQGMGLPQSTFELGEVDWNNSMVECESLEHHPISTPKPNQVPITDTSVIAASTSKLLSGVLQEVSIRCRKRTQLPTIQINLSHSGTLGSSNIQKKDFKKKRKKDFKRSNLSQEQAHTSLLGQNARVGVLALTYNVNSVTDLHNQRDSCLNDLD